MRNYAFRQLGSLFPAVSLVTILLLASCGGEQTPTSLQGTPLASLILSDASRKFLDENGALLLGKAKVGESITVVLGFVNAGEQEISDLAATFTGGFFQFTGGSFPGTGVSCANPLPRQGLCNVSVTFTPSASATVDGKSLGTLKVSYLRGTKNKASLFEDYAAEKVETEFPIAANYFIETPPLPSGPSLLVFMPESLNFFTNVIGSSKILSISITNNGVGAAFGLARGAFGNADYAHVPGGSCATVILPGATCTLDVQFTPTSPGPQGGLSLIEYQDSTGNFSKSYLASGFAVTPGDVDTSFINNGFFFYSAGGFDDRVNASVVQADGKIILVGSTFNGSNKEFLLMRLSANGDVDTSFFDPAGISSIPGVVMSNFGRTSELNAVALQTIAGTTKIVVAGYTMNPGIGRDFAVARYNLDGTIDTTFGSSGYAITDFAGKADNGNALVIQSDGKIIVGGSAKIGGSGGPIYFAAARYTANGVLDSGVGGFGDDMGGGNRLGMLVSPFPGFSNEIQGLALVPGSNAFVAAGYNIGFSTRSFALAKFTADGDLDTSFGTSGYVDQVVSSNPCGCVDDVARAIAIVPSGPDAGKLLVGGYSFGATNNDFALARFTATGVLDASFGTGGSGIVLDAVGGVSNEKAFSLLLQSDLKILLAGRSATAGSGDLTLTRYLSDGTRDPLFGNGGAVITDMGGDETGTTVVLQTIGGVGKIIVSGFSAFPGGSTQLVSVRYWQ